MLLIIITCVLIVICLFFSYKYGERHEIKEIHKIVERYKTGNHQGPPSYFSHLTPKQMDVIEELEKELEHDFHWF